MKMGDKSAPKPKQKWRNCIHGSTFSPWTSTIEDWAKTSIELQPQALKKKLMANIMILSVLAAMKEVTAIIPSPMAINLWAHIFYSSRPASIEPRR